MSTSPRRYLTEDEDHELVDHLREILPRLEQHVDHRISFGKDRPMAWLSMCSFLQDSHGWTLKEIGSSRAELRARFSRIRHELSEELVGSISTGQEFEFHGRTFKRVGFNLVGQGNQNGDKLYTVRILPNAKDNSPLKGHQDCIIVQEKETGGFYFAECHETIKHEARELDSDP